MYHCKIEDDAENDTRRQLWTGGAVSITFASHETELCWDGQGLMIYKNCTTQHAILRKNPNILIFLEKRKPQYLCASPHFGLPKWWLEPQTLILAVWLYLNSYRLAPEAPFPAAFEDSVTAAKHFLSNAKKFNVDPLRVALAGWWSYAHLHHYCLYFFFT